MIKFTHSLPNDQEFYLACSGGVDSVSALHFLAQGRRKPKAIIHVHHNTGAYADTALQFVEEIYPQYSYQLIVKRVKGTPPPGASKEAWWREQRYNLFTEAKNDWNSELPIVLAHNLDDCVEQYVMSTMIRPKRNPIIQYNGPSNTIRPFRMWAKTEILDYARRNNLRWVEDPSNQNTDFTRNKVRHELLPMITRINPGIYKHVRKLIEHESLQNTKGKA